MVRLSLPLGLLLLSYQSLAVTIPSASSTPSSNFSLSLTSQSSASPTVPPCCFVVPMTVGLNVWWNTTLTATVATVVTQYLNYNNTILTNTTTIYNATATDDVHAPPSLIPGNLIYSRTFYDIGTTVDFTSTVMTYPTPYVGVILLAYLPGETGTDSAGAATCTPGIIENPQDNFYQLSDQFVFVPTPTTVWSAPDYVEAPTQLIDAWVSQTPNITEKIPDLTTCKPTSGSGEPSVHIPVTALTGHSTTTINMGGAAPVTTPTLAPEPQPSETPQPEPEPEPTPTPEPEPEPSANPGPSENPGEPTTSSPEPTSNPEPPQTPDQPTSGAEQPQPEPPQQQPSSPAPTQNPPTSPSQGQPQPPPPAVSNPSNPDTPAPAPIPGPTLPVPVVPITNTNTPGVVLPGGETLTPGATTTISGHEVVVPTGTPSGVVLPGGQTLTPGGTTTISGQEVFVPTAPPNVIILPGGQTLSQGGTTTINGQEIVVPSNAPSVIVVDGSTQPAPSLVVVDGTTQLAPSNVVVIDGTTLPVQATASVTGDSAPVTTNAPVSSITIGESVVPVTFTTGPSGTGIVLPNGETLLPGSTVTYNGETISLSTGPSATDVQVIDSTTTKTIPLYTPTTLPPSSNAVGTGATGTGEYPSQFTGSAPRTRSYGWILAVAAAVMAML